MPVEHLDMFWLGVDVDRLGGGRLHAIGQLEALDPRGELGLGGEAVVVERVEPLDEVQFGALLAVGNVGGPVRGCRSARLGVEVRPLVNAWQKGRAPVRGVALGQAATARVAHHDEAGQVLALAAQAVSHPRAHARKTHPRQTRVHHKQSWRVIVRLCISGVDEGHLVDVFAQVREDLRDHLAALALRAKLERRLHQAADGVLEEARSCS